MARTLTLVLLSLVLVVAAACGGSGGGDADDDPVQFLVFGDPEEIQAFRDVVRAYAAEDPASPVELVEASDRTDLLARLATSTAAGTPPDVFLLNYRYYGQFAAKDAIEPLTNRLNDSEAFRPEDFYPKALEAFEWQGEQLCLPQNISSLVVYYNKDLFKRAGIPEPQAGWSFAEMTSIAKRLTLDAAGNPIIATDPDQGGGTGKAETYGLGVEPTIIRIAPFVWSNGGEVFDDESNPTRMTLDTPEAQKVLQDFLGLRTKSRVTPSDVEVEAEDDETRFASGRLAMLLSSRRSTPLFRTITDFEWDVAPLPVFREQAGILHSDAYCMAAASERQDAAWRFMEFALGPEGQRIVAGTGRTVPSLISVSRSAAFLDPSKPPSRSQVFLDGIPTIRRVPTISTWAEVEDASEPILENGFYLGWEADRVARELDEVTRPILARAEGP